MGRILKDIDMYAINFAGGFVIAGPYDNDTDAAGALASGKYFYLGTGALPYGLVPGTVMRVP